MHRGVSGGGTLAIYTDSPDFAARVLPGSLARRLAAESSFSPLERPLLGAFLGDVPLFQAPWEEAPWSHLLLAERAPCSNYDLLIELARSATPPPDRTACLAGRGVGFHGFKGRRWAAVPGNLHLSVFFAPHRPVERFEVAFTMMAALSVVDALDGVAGMRGTAGIKWVNDVMVDDAKVAGVLAYTQTQDRTVNAAVLGMGVNVEVAPAVEPTPFVPAVTSVRDALGAGHESLQASVLGGLLDALDRNYQTLLDDGYRPLLDRYRRRSVIVGREVTICSEDSDEIPEVIAHGVVREIGDRLEIRMEGREESVTRGRMILGAPVLPASFDEATALSARSQPASVEAVRRR